MDCRWLIIQSRITFGYIKKSHIVKSEEQKISTYLAQAEVPPSMLGTVCPYFQTTFPRACQPRHQRLECLRLLSAPTTVCPYFPAVSSKHSAFSSFLPFSYDFSHQNICFVCQIGEQLTSMVLTSFVALFMPRPSKRERVTASRA
jgi:hypothetical protein